MNIKRTNIRLLILFISCFLGVNGWAQHTKEVHFIQAIEKENKPKKRFNRIMALGEFYKENNIEKADSIRKVILEESRVFDDTTRFNALFFSAEVALIKGDLDDYFKTILACQPFLNKIESEDVRFKIYRHLGYYHTNMQEFETAEFYFRSCIRISKRERKKIDLSESYAYFALNFMQANAKDSALLYVDKAIQIARNAKDKISLAKAFNTQARIYDFFGQIELGVAKNLISLQLVEEVHNVLLLAQYTRELGVDQQLILNFSDAELYYNQSLRYARTIHDQRQVALAQTRLASVQLERGDYEAAIANANSAIEHLTALNDYNGLGQTHNILGKIFKAQKKYNKASSNFNQALVYYESTSNKEEIAGVYHNVGTIFKEQKKYQKALDYLNRSIEIRKEYGAKNQIYYTYRIISDVYKDINNKSESLKYLELYLNYVDSNTILQSATKIAELSESYRSEHRDRLIKSQADSLEKQQQDKIISSTKLENSQLRNNFQMYIIVAFLIITILAVIILFYRWNQTKIKQEQKDAEMSQALLRTQMNPHFIFNAMSVIQSYIFENDTVNSSKFLVNFSRLMRLILENSPKEAIHIETEMEILEKYLGMQKLRFEDRFEFKITAEEELYHEHAVIPPMITQPFIENAIEHGQLHTVDGGFIHVSFKKEGGMLKISIIDNGIGRKGSSSNKSSAHKSMAMDITSQRIQNLNRKYNSDGELIVEDFNKELETGTKVLISLPYRIDNNPAS